jgi:3-oxoacyl-[acyl-carrier-protein] synthase I
MSELNVHIVAEGVVAPGVQQVGDLRRLAEGYPGAAPRTIDLFPVDGYSCRLAFQAETEPKDPDRARRAVDQLVRKVQAEWGVEVDIDAAPVDPATAYLFACCDQLEEELGGALPQLLGDRVAILLGTCSAYLPNARYVAAHALSDPGNRSVRILQCLPMFSGTLVKLYLGWDIDAPVSAHVTTTGCTASLDAIGRAAVAVQSGRVDFAVAGGMDVVNEPLLRGFDAARSLTDAPCRPFDAAHRGFQLGEGAGLVVLAGAVGSGGAAGRIEAFGTALDGYRLTVPHPHGTGLRAAFAHAVRQADAPPGGVVGHGTAVPGNDEIELSSYAAHLAPGTPVMSLKSLFGHSLGAAGVHSVLLALQALRMDALPGTQNLENPLPTPLRLSPGHVPLRGSRVAVCAPAFGGNNAALVLARATS